MDHDHNGKSDSRVGFAANAFQRFAARIHVRRTALLVMIAVISTIPVVALGIAGHAVFGNPADSGHSESVSRPESQDPSEYTSDISQAVYSQDIPLVEVSIPKWFSPGELVANQFYQNFLSGTIFRQTLSSQYVHINAQKDAISKTEEHKNCSNFRFNLKTGTLECIDHFIRETLIPTGIMENSDRIHFLDCTPSDEYAMIDIRTSDDKHKSTYRFHLQTGDFLKINQDMNQLDDWTIFKDYSTLVTDKYSFEWTIWLTDIVSGTKKNIVSEENATEMYALSPDNRYIWYSIFQNGNKNLRCIYQIDTGAKAFITSERYPFFTADGQFILYFSQNQIRRLRLGSQEDVVLVEDASWMIQAGIDIAAYDDASGTIILWAYYGALHFNLYSLDIGTGNITNVVDPAANSSAQSGSADLQSALDEASGANLYLFDKTGKYIFYYTDLDDRGGRIYCYDIASGEQFAVALPEEFVKKLMAERQNLLYPDQPFPVQYRLYLSDDATRIYLTYEILRSIYVDPIPLSKLVEYAEKYNTIIHFGKYFDPRYYGNELPGRCYSTYTDDGKVAVLNENYSTRKFTLVLFDKPLDASKPYGGGEVLVQKDLPVDADGFLADWWDHYYDVGTLMYSLDDVKNFLKTHDSLDGFTKIYGHYSIGMNEDSGKQTAFFYQICIGPNDYINVMENYAEKKLQIIRSKTLEIIFESALNPAVSNSDRLQK